MRALVGVAAGIVAGYVMPFNPASIPIDQFTAVIISIGIAVAFYIVSLVISRSIAKSVPREKRRKVATEGIVPFIFLLLVFMIIMYTALHQSVVLG